MKASELRIGNKARFSEDARICTITGIPPQRTGKGIDVLFDDGEEIWIELDQFEPIPLTEEWLLKFGFEDHKLILPNRGAFESYLIAMTGVARIQICKNGYYAYDPEIHHVHQLQNLYFALTGEELTIKE